MKLIGTSLLASIVLMAGCASSALDSSAAKDASDHEVADGDRDAPADEALTEETEVASDTAVDDADSRRVGDYVTYSFSGGYRKSPLRLTQTVVSRATDSITIDYAFTESNTTDTLRVTASTAKKSRGRIASVERVLADGKIADATAADFDAKMAGTAAIADENEALVDERNTTVRVGTADVTAKQSVYKVRLGKKSATLETMTSEGFAWGDLGGKITTSDGKIFFQAELVDAGGPSAARASLE